MSEAASSVARARGGARVGRVLSRLTRVQMRHPVAMLLLAWLSVAIAGLLASKLSLKTSFGELLPQNKQSVIVAERVAKRLVSRTTLTVVIEGSDDDELRAFVDALAPKLRAIEPALVSSVDTGAKSAREFFQDNRFVYADLKVLQEVHDEVEERYGYEVNKAAGFLLDEDEPPPPITEKTIRQRLEARTSGDKRKPRRERFPEYYLDSESHTIAALIRTPIRSGDIEASGRLRQLVLDAVAAVEKERGNAGKVGLTGNLITSAETHEQIKNDLAHVGIWGGALILGIVLLFYLRLRTLLAMTHTVTIGAAWTFGLAYLLIGHLNSSTGFLFSIVVGNGINFGIIYMARYLEARRTEGVERSALTAHLDTWLSTLTAAAAATAAYGSLVVTDFRGFKHFGIIGGSGMLLCWLATYLFLPPLLAITERVSPIKPPTGVIAKVRGLYGRPFAWLAARYPLTVTAAGLAITIVAGYLAYGFVVDPMEYDMSNIANARRQKDSRARELSRKVDKIIGRQVVDIVNASEKVDWK